MPAFVRSLALTLASSGTGAGVFALWGAALTALLLSGPDLEIIGTVFFVTLGYAMVPAMVIALGVQSRKLMRGLGEATLFGSCLSGFLMSVPLVHAGHFSSPWTSAFVSNVLFAFFFVGFLPGIVVSRLCWSWLRKD